MTLQEYYQGIDGRVIDHPSERYGQAAFNLLSEVRPLMAQQIQELNIDPFYLHDNVRAGSETWRYFTQFLEENWNDNGS